MRRSILTQVAVVVSAVVVGGWLLQEGVGRSDTDYLRVRVLQEVIDKVESSFVEEVEYDRLHESAIEGLFRDLGDPHSSLIPANAYENLRIMTPSLPSPRTARALLLPPGPSILATTTAVRTAGGGRTGKSANIYL